MGSWRSYVGEERFSSSILIASIGIFAVLWFLLAFKKSRKGAVPPLPPGPRGVPILGYLPFIGTELHTKLQQLVGIYGPIYKIWLANKLCVVISSPSLAREVLRDQDAVFANRDANAAALAITDGGADIAFSPNGPHWRMLRKMFVREMLSSANIDSTFALRREQVRNTIKNVYDKIGTPIDLGEMTFVTAMNVIMNMLWGGTLRGEEGAKYGAEFKRMFSDLMLLIGKPNVSDLFPALASFDLQGIVRGTKGIGQNIERVLDYAIEKQMKKLAKAREEGTTKTGQKDFLQVLLEIREQDNGEASITLNQLKAALMDIVVGATDTTTTLSEWAMAWLIKYPEMMRKVQQELTEIVGMDNIVEEIHLSKLHYLEAVIKETLRLHPPLPFLIPRTPSKSSVIGGYHVPKGSKILLHVYAIQRDPQYWDSPLEFKPERFLNNTESNFDFSGNNFKYFPFGSGRRVCPGITLGEKSIKYILASLLHSFEWKLPHGSEIDVADTFGIITKKKNPTNAIPTPRLFKSELYAE